MSAAKSNTLRRLVRRWIAPPFWVLRYEVIGRGGMFARESGESALLADVRDSEAADREARKYLERTCIVGGECRYTITLRPWWMRLRFTPNNALHVQPGREAGGL